MVGLLTSVYGIIGFCRVINVLVGQILLHNTIGIGYGSDRIDTVDVIVG